MWQKSQEDGAICSRVFSKPVFSSRYFPHTNHYCYKRLRSSYGKEISFIKAMNSHHLRPEFLQRLCKTDIYLLRGPHQVQQHDARLNFPGQVPSGATNTPDTGVRDHWCPRPKASVLPPQQSPTTLLPQIPHGQEGTKNGQILAAWEIQNNLLKSRENSPFSHCLYHHCVSSSSPVVSQRISMWTPIT